MNIPFQGNLHLRNVMNGNRLWLPLTLQKKMSGMKAHLVQLASPFERLTLQERCYKYIKLLLAGGEERSNIFESVLCCYSLALARTSEERLVCELSIRTLSRVCGTDFPLDQQQEQQHERFAHNRTSPNPNSTRTRTAPLIITATKVPSFLPCKCFLSSHKNS